MKVTKRRLLVMTALLLGSLGVALVGNGAGSALAAAGPSAQDRAWLQAAHQSNLSEIQAGQVAQRKATSSVVRQHGALFIRDHTRLDANLRVVAGQLGVALPSRPNAQQRAILASVTAKSGAAFDSSWLQSQLTAHRQAKAAGQTELAQGSDARVKALAQAAAPVIQAHLTMLEQTLGLPTGVAGGTGGQAAWLPGGRAAMGALFVALAAVLAALAVMIGRRRTV
jgi:putative membrane protein